MRIRARLTLTLLTCFFARAVSAQARAAERAAIGVWRGTGQRWCQSASDEGASPKQMISFTPPLQFVATTSKCADVIATLCSTTLRLRNRSN